MSAAPAARVLPMRRLLRRPEAAAYVGASATTFDAWIASGLMPQGRRIGGVVVWDVRALDEAVDALLYGEGAGGLTTSAPTEVNPWPTR